MAEMQFLQEQKIAITLALLDFHSNRLVEAKLSIGAGNYIQSKIECNQLKFIN